MESTNALLTIPINPNSFPAKLWYLVNSPHTQSVNWDSIGKGILIDQQLFEAELLAPSKKLQRKLPYLFKTVNFQSFVRQLNLYGFKKRCQGQGHSKIQIDNCSFRSGVHHFYSPSFLQGHPELLVNLKRLTRINKAKLKAGIEIKCRPPGRLRCRLLKSNGRSSAVKDNGLDSVSNQHLWFERKTTAVCHQYSSNHWQQVEKCKSLLLPSQAWISDNSNASSIRPLYPDKEMPASVLQNYPTDSPYVCPSSAMHSYGSHSMMSSGKFLAFMPSGSPYQYLPVCHRCPPGSLDSDVVCCHHSAASYPFYGYYPSFSANYFHPCGHQPDRPSSDTPETKNNDFKMTDELQVSPPMCMVKCLAMPEGHVNTSNSGSFSSSTTASFLYNTQASTSDSSSATAWAQHDGVVSSVAENVPSAFGAHISLHGDPFSLQTAGSPWFKMGIRSK